MKDAAPIVDDEARRRALEIGESFIVQAPAGSGKTELLTQRLLALLGSVNRPEEILAITFTRKAAGEMRTRLLEALEAASGPPPQADHALRTWELARQADRRDRERGWHLRENPARLNVQTIDSFCASLVRRMPWISRFGGVPAIAENPRDLYRDAADRILSRAAAEGRGGAEVRLLLHHLDNRMGKLRDLLVAMLQRRDQWLRHLVDPDAARKRAKLEGALRSLVEEYLREADGALPDTCREALVELGRFAAGNLPEDRPRPLLGLAEVSVFPAPVAGETATWCGMADLLLTGKGTLRRKVDVRCGFPAAGDPSNREMKQRMEEMLALLPTEASDRLKAVSVLPAAAYAEDQWNILDALVELLPLAVAELWLVFRQRNEVDFAEIALKALEALGTAVVPSDLLLRLDAAIRHILVDEFQDTSCLQYELIKRLTAGWLPEDGRSLFLVGDPMQSIYRFREAEVGLFLQTRRRGIASLRPTALELKSNFRSQQGIVRWVNQSFARIFPRLENPSTGAVACAEAMAVHPALDGSAVTVHPFLERHDSAEAERVADLVQAARLERPEEEIALLVRSRTHLPEILRHLRRRGIRYQAQDIDLLEDRPAARDVVSLTRALLHPGDRLAWLAVLRGPWCGLTLADLLALCGDDPHRTIGELLDSSSVLDRLGADGKRRAARTAVCLRAAIRRRGRIGLRPLVEGCWFKLGGPACYDRRGLEDAAAVFDLLEKLDHGGDLASFEALDEAMKSLFAPVDAEADGKLQVMTIHRAKGLEFDTVILPGLGRSPARNDRTLLRWLEHPDCGLLLAPIARLDGSSRDAIYDMIGRLEAEKEGLETARLLYVAATRAKRRLHLVGHAKVNGRGEPAPASGSLLDKLWPAVAGAFAAETAKPDPGALPRATEGGRLHRLPDDWRLPVFDGAPLPGGRKVEKPSDLADRDFAAAFHSEWERAVARHVGTVVHVWLERIAREGLETWLARGLTGQENRIERRLLTLGVPPGRLAVASGKVLRALEAALAGETGRWILQSHLEGGCEVPLSGMIAGRMVHAVIDRTFVDRDGVRWIIDYKSGEETPRNLEAFLNREADRYREQLNAYATLFRGLEPERPIRTALYFPLLGEWCEVLTAGAQKCGAGN